MSAVVVNRAGPAAGVPLLAEPQGPRPLVFGAQSPIGTPLFLAEVLACAERLPESRYAINICEDRYAFLVAFCATALRGQVTLLPHARARGVIADYLLAYPDSYCLGEAAVTDRPPRFHALPPRGEAAPAGAQRPLLPPEQLVAIGFTSGSTGEPKANPKTWGSFHASTAHNAALLRRVLGFEADSAMAVVATVPAQHMYGMELSVLLPLLSNCAVCDGRPLFPADIVAALHGAPQPPVLVTTPLHLRSLLDSGLALPAIAGIVTATAPLAQALAFTAEQQYSAPVLELFGSTETCVIAHRRTARDELWTLVPQVSLVPQPDGVAVDAPWFDTSVLMQDVVELCGEGSFRLCGRNTDLLEIAGKRASLGELTRQLLQVDGVQDAIVLQADGSGVQRIVALAVAPGRDACGILAALRERIDPAFLPRPLRLVDALPRNEVGKLPREAVLRLLG